MLHLRDCLAGLRIEDGLDLVDGPLQEGLLLDDFFLPDVLLEVVELVVEEVVVFGEETVYLCQLAHFFIVVGALVAARRIVLLGVVIVFMPFGEVLGLLL